MGKVRKENGKWIVDFRFPRRIAMKYGVARFRRGYEKKALAEKVHGQIQAAIALNDPEGIIGRILGAGINEYTVQTFYERWMAEYVTPRLEATTKKRYELSFKTINDLCGTMSLADFSRGALHSYIQLRSGKVSASTINKDIIAIKKMFSYAFEIGAIENNPLTRFPALRIQEKALVVPTVEEFHKLVDSMPDPALGAMVAVIGETGMRRSEAINLEWKYVNLRTGRITLERTKGKRVRTVPLSEFALSKLRSLHRFVHQPQVFCHQISGAPWVSPDKKFRAGRQKAGLDWVTFHTLRHMRGTRWVEHGADVQVVKEGLGHRDIRTTDRYTKHVKNRIEQALREAQLAEKVAGEKREEKKG